MSSSTSSVCQGLQSCLEPRVIEPRVLRLKLAPPAGSSSSGKASPPSSLSDTISYVGGFGWSFLQSDLTHNTCHCNKTEDPQDVYVHPTVKRSSSMLSEKSLEMCTESLGSETGSNAGESSDDIMISLLSLESSSTRHDTTTTTTLSLRSLGGYNTSSCVSKRVLNRASTFPPPLTSITDFGVRPHREDGRLILEAVPSPSPRPYFHADRSEGRLTLRLLDTFSDEEEEEEEEDEDEGCGEGDSEIEEDCVENVEDEMGVGTKFARPIRCKESGNGVIRGMFVDAASYFELPSLSLCL